MLGSSPVLALPRIYIAFIHSVADREIKWGVEDKKKRVNKWPRRPQPELEYKTVLLDCKSTLYIPSCIASHRETNSVFDSATTR